MFTFSIITANYNSGIKLGKTVASVLQQGAMVEHIIVDGASTDQSLITGRQLAIENRTQIQLVSEPDRGVYDAMNKGVKLAQGRYILFLGAGDLLEPGILPQVLPELPDHDNGFVYGDVKWGASRYAGEFTWQRLYFLNICQQGIFYGKRVFEHCGLFDLRYRAHADWEMNLRCFGAKHVEKKYLDLVIAEFELGGLSGRGDADFERDKLHLVRKNLGWWQYFTVKRWRLKAAILARIHKIIGPKALSG